MKRERKRGEKRVCEREKEIKWKGGGKGKGALGDIEHQGYTISNCFR